MKVTSMRAGFDDLVSALETPGAPPSSPHAARVTASTLRARVIIFVFIFRSSGGG
jgi:hypothetical protein